MPTDQIKHTSNAGAEIVPIDIIDIQNMIYTFRGQQVMLDFDLARIYGYEVKAMNQQVKRNLGRFPEDFMFQLTMDEIDSVKSQFVTSQETSFFASQSGGRRKPPNAFTEQGIYMLSTVLHGPAAEQQSIFIMRAFREMRRFVANNAMMFERISRIELRQLEYENKSDEKFGQIFEYISGREESSQKVFFDGQIYDAFSLIASIIQKAKKEMILIDGYVDTATLDLLSKKQANVAVSVYTGTRGCKLTKTEIDNFNNQYPSLNIRYINNFHDRFLILDRKTCYHIGASLKDAGKKCFAISLIKDAKNVQGIIARL